MIPTGYEVAQLIEETLRLTNSTKADLAQHSNLKPSAINRLLKSNEPSSPATLRSLNDGITQLINSLSPFEPPAVGFEREWLTLYQAIRHYLLAIQSDVLNPIAMSAKPPRKGKRYQATESGDIRRWKKEMER